MEKTSKTTSSALFLGGTAHGEVMEIEISVRAFFVPKPMPIDIEFNSSPSPVFLDTAEFMDHYLERSFFLPSDPRFPCRYRLIRIFIIEGKNPEDYTKYLSNLYKVFLGY